MACGPVFAVPGAGGGETALLPHAALPRLQAPTLGPEQPSPGLWHRLLLPGSGSEHRCPLAVWTWLGRASSPGLHASRVRWVTPEASGASPRHYQDTRSANSPLPRHRGAPVSTWVQRRVRGPGPPPPPTACPSPACVSASAEHQQDSVHAARLSLQIQSLPSAPRRPRFSPFH